MITKITNNLYIGDLDDVANRDAENFIQLIRSLGVTTIISLLETKETHEENLVETALQEGTKIKYVWFPIDSGKRDVADEFSDAYNRLVAILAQTGEVVLLHCRAGIDRAPFLAALYLHHHLNISIQEAYTIIKKKRPCVIEHYEWLAALEKKNTRF